MIHVTRSNDMHLIYTPEQLKVQGLAQGPSCGPVVLLGQIFEPLSSHPLLQASGATLDQGGPFPQKTLPFNSCLHNRHVVRSSQAGVSHE